MQVYRHLPNIKSSPLALAIGNFDGMHLGHQALLSRLAEVAKTKKLTPAVMTFEPHPREFFTPLNAPERLCNLREKLEQFEVLGIEKCLFVLSTKALQQSARKILCKKFCEKN